jgi:hypothetical protein
MVSWFPKFGLMKPGPNDYFDISESFLEPISDPEGILSM